VNDHADLEALIRESFSRQGLMRTFNASVTVVSAGRVILEMPVSEAISQQDGFVHAGAISSLVDSACGYAALTTMPADSNVLAVEFKINFVAPAIGMRIRATGNVIKSGRTITLCQGEAHAILLSGDEKLVAVMQATMIRQPRLPREVL
jgi:uncharacterized protein (TIGR00369 family)